MSLKSISAGLSALSISAAIFTPLGSSTSIPTASSNSSSSSIVSYASTPTMSFLSNPRSWNGSSSAEKLTFYQELCLAFEVCRPGKVPQSIKKCKDLLRSQVHISLGEFVRKVVDRGEPVANVHRYNSKKELRKALNDPKTKRELRLNLGQAKKEMLQPFLIKIR